MKTIKILMAFLMVTAFASCDKETTGDVSRVTNFPLFVVDGGNPVFIELGTAYVEPGVTASENSADIPVVTTALGSYRDGVTLDENISDWYSLTYTATNADGFAGTASRDVWVVETGDLTTSIAGLYTSSVERNGTTAPQYQDMAWVLIWENSDGTYGISDGFGGWYPLGRALGLRYNSSGAVITANDIGTNDFSFNTFANDAFGGTADITAMTVDAGTKTINFTCVWDVGTVYTFEATLTQVAL